MRVVVRQGFYCKMKLRVQALRPALAIGARGALPFVGGASKHDGGLSLQKRRATSYARGVTAGKMGRGEPGASCNKC